MSIPDKLVEFVSLPFMRPSWAHEIRVWEDGTITSWPEGIDRPTYMISFAADLLRAKRQFKGVYWLENAAKSLGLKSRALESASYHNHSVSCVSELCDIVEDLAAQYAGLDYEQIRCTIMPREGSPWKFNAKETIYYSSRAEKLLRSTPPPIRITEYWKGNQKKKRPVIDWCKISPVIECSGLPNTIAMSFYEDRNNETYFASHCFTSLKGLRTALRECDGLLMPSIGVGLVPSANFGSFVLIADPVMVLQGLKPYRTGRGQYPVHVYRTDTWTTTTSALFGDRGAEALEEWVGYDTGNLTDDFSLLLDWTPRNTRSDEPLRRTKQMLSRLNVLRRKWNDPTLDMETLEFDPNNHYPYIEAKVNGITPLKCYTVAFCPMDTASAFRRVLRRGGFRGSVYGVPGVKLSDVTSPDGHDIMTKQQQWDYGWKIRGALLRLIEKNPSREHSVSN